jgi:uncharacterized protein (UPF0297 family)
MNENMNETMKFEAAKEVAAKPKEILDAVVEALKEKNYDPIDQIIGYILSGDPTYITSHNNARSMIRQIERDELLEEILKSYLQYDK